MDYSIVTGHLSLYKFFPTQKILFTMRGGRYLAGDSGITMDFSRKFNNGLQIGAFLQELILVKPSLVKVVLIKAFISWYQFKYLQALMLNIEQILA